MRSTATPSALTTPAWLIVTSAPGGTTIGRFGRAHHRPAVGDHRALGRDVELAVARVGRLAGHRRHREEELALGHDVERVVGGPDRSLREIGAGRNDAGEDLVLQGRPGAGCDTARGQERLKRGARRLVAGCFGVRQVVGDGVELVGSRRRRCHAYVHSVCHVRFSRAENQQGRGQRSRRVSDRRRSRDRDAILEVPTGAPGRFDPARFAGRQTGAKILRRGLKWFTDGAETKDMRPRTRLDPVIKIEEKNEERKLREMAAANRKVKSAEEALRGRARRRPHRSPARGVRDRLDARGERAHARAVRRPQGRARGQGRPPPRKARARGAYTIAHSKAEALRRVAQARVDEILAAREKAESQASSTRSAWSRSTAAAASGPPDVRIRARAMVSNLTGSDATAPGGAATVAPEPTRRSGRARQIRQRLSLCMIVRNEEKRLGRCLASAMPWVGEAIVVDTGSTDGTARPGRERPARACCTSPGATTSRWRATTRWRAATREWVLVLDADEILRVDDAAAWARALAADPADASHATAAYSIDCHDRIDDGGVAVGPVMRLFRRAVPRHALPRRDPRADRRRRRAPLRGRARALHPHRPRRPHRRGRRRAPHRRAQPAPGAADGRVAPRRSLQLVLPRARRSRPPIRQSGEVISAFERALEKIELARARRIATRAIWRRCGSTWCARWCAPAARARRSRSRRRALCDFAGSPDLHFLRGKLLLDAGHVAAACRELEECLTPAAARFFLRQDPGAVSYAAETQLAICCLKLGQLDRAVRTLRHAVESAPAAFHLPRFLLGILLISRGAAAEAEPLLAAVVAAAAPGLRRAPALGARAAGAGPARARPRSRWRRWAPIRAWRSCWRRDALAIAVCVRSVAIRTRPPSRRAPRGCGIAVACRRRLLRPPSSLMPAGPGICASPTPTSRWS